MSYLVTAVHSGIPKYCFDWRGGLVRYELLQRVAVSQPAHGATVTQLYNALEQRLPGVEGPAGNVHARVVWFSPLAPVDGWSAMHVTARKVLAIIVNTSDRNAALHFDNLKGRIPNDVDGGATSAESSGFTVRTCDARGHAWLLLLLLVAMALTAACHSPFGPFGENGCNTCDPPQLNLVWEAPIRAGNVTVFRFDYDNAPNDDSIATMSIAFGDGKTASFTLAPFSHTLSVPQANTYSTPGIYAIVATMTTAAGTTYSGTFKITVTD